ATVTVRSYQPLVRDSGHGCAFVSPGLSDSVAVRGEYRSATVTSIRWAPWFVRSSAISWCRSSYRARTSSRVWLPPAPLQLRKKPLGPCTDGSSPDPDPEPDPTVQVSLRFFPGSTV